MIVAGHSASFPGCLSSIVTLSIPLEQRVLRFKEEFTQSITDVRSRLAQLVGRANEVGEETAALAGRADKVEKKVAEAQRQTSDMSEKLDSSLTECERRQAEVEQHAVNLEVRTTLLESHDPAAMARDMEKLARQMEDMQERLTLAESDATKAKIARDYLQQNMANRARLAEALLQRLLSVENRFENSFPGSGGQPMRSLSHP